MRKKIRISIGILREASNCIKKIPLLLLFPIVPFAATMGVLCFFVYGGAAIGSVSDEDTGALTAGIQDAAGSTGLNATAVQMDSKNVKYYMLTYHFFFTLWLNSLVGDCANSTALSRARPVISAAKQTLRTRGVPHVMFGATEYTTTVP